MRSGESEALRVPLELLCCPRCGGELSYERELLKCDGCGLDFFIHDGIPLLLELDLVDKHLRKQMRYFKREADRRSGDSLEPWQRRYLERFLENFQVGEGDLVVDFGTGCGFMSIELARMGCHCIACDLTLENLIRLKAIASEEELPGRIYPVCCDAQALPVRSGIADFLIAINVLEHLPRDDVAVTQVGRVCKSKAGIMITGPLALKYVYPCFIPVHIIHDMMIGHLRHYSSEELDRLFSAWKCVREYYTGHFMKVVKIMASMLRWPVDWEKVEAEDRKLEGIRYGASAVTCVFERSPEAGH